LVAATGTSPPTTRSALFKSPSRAPAARDKGRSISRSTFRFRRPSTPTPSTPLTP
jgi:hypothetical protein